MKRISRVGSLIFLVLIIAFFPYLYSRLTKPVEIPKKEGFSGVLKLWAVDGYHGAALSWVGTNVAAFEKKHSGVYIHTTRMSEEILAQRLERGERPDMIVFPAGAVSNPGDLLMPIECPGVIREAYVNSVSVGGICFAVPVMAGGYAMLVNSDRLGLDALPPEDWNALIDSLYVGNKQIKKRQYALACAGVTQRAAPIAMLSLLQSDASYGMAKRRGETLPAHFAKGDWDSALSAFVQGQCAIMLATQREIRRIDSLDTQGLNFTAYVPEREGLFTDQVSYIGIVSPDNPSEKRLEACMEFSKQLISESSQQDLAEYSVFSSRDDITLYDGDMAPMLSLIEKSLSRYPLIPNAFAWAESRSLFADYCEQFLLGESDKNPLLYLP